MTEITSRLSTALADRYQIERHLGEGGMATVYLAEDLKHKRKVAVKVLRPELAAAVGHDRFLREITTTANLRHPHILPLYDSGEAGEFLFYVMPYVEGESLRDRLDRDRQLPLDEALEIAREVADALSYAHSRGVIHRDIKPDNILLESGHAVVADFGIARAVDAAGGDRLTETGMSIGTPTYMSPEQAAGEGEVDGRSDLYALACVLYEMLGGQPPFTGPTATSVIHQHLTAEPRPITQIRSAVPDEIAGVLQRALAKNPADRFSVVTKFADALRAAPLTTGATSGTTSATTSRQGSGFRKPVVLTAALLLVGVMVVVGSRRLGFWGDRPSSSAVPSVAVLPFVDLSGGENEYLGDGMAETLISALSKIEGLRVAARTSAFSFKGRNEDVRTIGSALGVGAVLEGSVQRAGEQLRITAQLVSTADGFDLWSRSFDRGVSDVFAVQDEVARAVVAALQVELIGDGSAPMVRQGTESIEAYQAYLQGLFFWNKRTTADIERSAAFFRQATAADSGFARAWAGLASAYVLFLPSEYEVRTITPAEALTHAEHAARRALALDDQLAAALTALAQILEKQGRVEEAGEFYRRAIASDPRYPTAHQWYATHLINAGRTAEALEQIREAARLDPLSLVILVELGEVLEADGQLEAATEAYERVIERYPDAYLTQFFGGLHLLMIGEFVRAGDLLGGLVATSTGNSAEGQRVREGIQDSTRRVTTLRTLAESNRVEWSVALYRMQGDDEGAVTSLERAVQGPQFESIYMAHVLAMLGPTVAARPRVRTAIDRWEARLRDRYGVRR